MKMYFENSVQLIHDLNKWWQQEQIKNYQPKLLSYIKKRRSDRLRFNPKIIEVNQTHVKFGMRYHHCVVFSIPRSILDKY